MWQRQLVGHQIGGLRSSFARLGNVESATDSNNKTTNFSYKAGIVSEIHTPAYTVTREINPEGTVASETLARRKTTFKYDDLFRIIETDPPGQSSKPVITTNDNGSSATAVNVKRGDVATETTVDGFGRPIRIEDSVVRRTLMRYDAEGRKIFEGYPYFVDPTGNLGTRIEYDGLWRVTKRTEP